jgi:hypothetical protein
VIEEGVLTVGTYDLNRQGRRIWNTCEALEVITAGVGHESHGRLGHSKASEAIQT